MTQLADTRRRTFTNGSGPGASALGPLTVPGPVRPPTEGALKIYPPVTAGSLDDVHYPAYTMGRAAEMIGVTAAFLRRLDDAGLITPQRSSGGHRRYSRHQLLLAARTRELVDTGTAMAAACRIVALEDELHAAHRRLTELGSRAG